MYVKTMNDKNVNIKLKRTELIDLLLLCSAQDAHKWDALHEKLFEQLKIFDSKHLNDID